MRRHRAPAPRPLQQTARLSMVAIVVTSLFVAMFARLLLLQVVESPELAAAATANQIRTVYTDAPRGQVLDIKGRVLAGNREVDVIAVDRAAVRKDKTLLPRLAAFLGTTESVLADRMADPKNTPYRPAPVAVDVDKGVLASFMERSSEFVGATAETRIDRYYPGGTLAAHVLGYVGEVNDREMAARKERDYRLGDKIGKSGIELALEEELRGVSGLDRVEVDSSGRVVRVLEHRPPVAGRDVLLTIDKDVQLAAERALDEGLAAARGRPNSSAVDTGGLLSAKAGSVVAIDPADGAVRAMASYPTFDPGSFTNGIGTAEYAQLTDPNGGLPLNNRTVQGQYAPGSTFKVVTAVAATRAGLVTPESTIVDNGAFYLGGQRFQNAQATAFGTVNLSRSLTVSSDVYYYQLGARFWERRSTLGDPIQDTAKAFGFGRTQGVIIGGEQPGRVPDPEQRRRQHEQRPDVFPEGNWYGGDNVNLSIGQGDMLVTPLQLANSYATFANGGTLYKPRLVEALLDPNGDPSKTFAPEKLATTDLAPNVYDAIATGLTGAVASPSGTAYAAFRGFDLSSFPVAGKTGTAQVFGKADSALFAGYGPVGDPRLAVGVILEESGYGGETAAPVARRVMAAAAGQDAGPVAIGSSTDR